MQIAARKRVHGRAGRAATHRLQNQVKRTVAMSLVMLVVSIGGYHLVLIMMMVMACVISKIIRREGRRECLCANVVATLRAVRHLPRIVSRTRIVDSPIEGQLKDGTHVIASDTSRGRGREERLEAAHCTVVEQLRGSTVALDSHYGEVARYDCRLRATLQIDINGNADVHSVVNGCDFVEQG